jgi:hypothetical protein
VGRKNSAGSRGDSQGLLSFDARKKSDIASMPDDEVGGFELLLQPMQVGEGGGQQRLRG